MSIPFAIKTHALEALREPCDIYIGVRPDQTFLSEIVKDTGERVRYSYGANNKVTSIIRSKSSNRETSLRTESHVLGSWRGSK